MIYPESARTGWQQSCHLAAPALHAAPPASIGVPLQAITAMTLLSMDRYHQVCLL